MAAEEGAKKVGRGIWDAKHETKRVVDQSNMRGAQAKQYLKFVQPQGGLTAIVEFVMNPVRLKQLPDGVMPLLLLVGEQDREPRGWTVIEKHG